MKVYLEYVRIRKYFVNREEYLAKYDSSRGNYKLLTGAPLLINVDGNYMYLDDILKFIRNDALAGSVIEWSKGYSNKRFEFHIQRRRRY